MEAAEASDEVVDTIPSSAMVVFAHPDDAEIGAGATTAKWARQGCKITYVLCTTGSSGSDDRSMQSEGIVPIRAAEQRAAADHIGVGEIVALDHPDGELEADREFLGELVRAIRTHRPEVVFTHDPYRLGGFQHKDHRNAGLTTMDAIYPYARDHLHFPEQLDEDGLEPFKVSELYFWGADNPGVIVDVSDTVETQIEALKKHESQVGGLATNSTVDTRIRERSSRIATGYSFRYGEAFRRLLARR